MRRLRIDRGTLLAGAAALVALGLLVLLDWQGSHLQTTVFHQQGRPSYSGVSTTCAALSGVHALPAWAITLDGLAVLGGLAALASRGNPTVARLALGAGVVAAIGVLVADIELVAVTWVGWLGAAVLWLVPLGAGLRLRRGR